MESFSAGVWAAQLRGRTGLTRVRVAVEEGYICEGGVNGMIGKGDLGREGTKGEKEREGVSEGKREGGGKKGRVRKKEENRGREN